MLDGQVLIGGHNYHRFENVVPDGQAKGLIPRDYSTHPRGFYSSMQAVDIKTIPRAEWSARIAQKVRNKTQISDIMRRKGVPCLNQKNRGYCWMHSGTAALMAVRAVMNQKTVGLSAYSAACKIKNFRDEGGWGAQGVDFLVSNGVCDETVWPQCGVSRSLDTPAAWENAKQYMVTEQIADLQAAQYDRTMTFDQFMTCWLLNNPTIDDHNFWGHSVMGADGVDGVSLRNRCRHDISGKLLTLAEFDLCWSMNDPVTAGFGCRLRNSWGEDWGESGFGILAGSKAIPDGGVGLLIAVAA